MSLILCFFRKGKKASFDSQPLSHFKAPKMLKWQKNMLMYSVISDDLLRFNRWSVLIFDKWFFRCKIQTNSPSGFVQYLSYLFVLRSLLSLTRISYNNLFMIFCGFNINTWHCSSNHLTSVPDISFTIFVIDWNLFLYWFPLSVALIPSI